MRCPPSELYALGDDAVVRAAVGDLAVLRLTGGMRHHGEIDVIEGTQANKLWLATKKFNFPLSPQLIPIGDLNVLLGRHS